MISKNWQILSLLPQISKVFSIIKSIVLTVCHNNVSNKIPFLLCFLSTWKVCLLSKSSSYFLPCSQSCSILNISVISSKFINKFVQKCHCYHTFSDQSIPLVTVTSIVSLLTEQLSPVLESLEMSTKKSLIKVYLSF